MNIGDTFILGEGGHLWIVISDPCKNSSKCVIANLTKDKNRAGTECELNPGDHQFITCKSYINFGDAQEVGPKEAEMIAANMEQGTIRKHFPVKPAILQKIIEAAKTSKALSTGLKSHFQDSTKTKK